MFVNWLSYLLLFNFDFFFCTVDCFGALSYWVSLTASWCIHCSCGLTYYWPGLTAWGRGLFPWGEGLGGWVALSDSTVFALLVRAGRVLFNDGAWNSNTANLKQGNICCCFISVPFALIVSRQIQGWTSSNVSNYLSSSTTLPRQI